MYPKDINDALYSIGGTYDVRLTADTARFTKALILVQTSGAVTGNLTTDSGVVAVPIHPTVAERILPFRTNAAFTVSGWTTVYCY